MFIDEIKVYARAGHGGKGAVAFHREAYIPKGGPSGGNGGRGGSVILQADHDLNNLIGQYYVPRLIAQVGEGGMGKGMDGHAGKDLIVKVPVGTLVWQLDSPQKLEPVEEAKTDADDADENEEIEKPGAKASFKVASGPALSFGTPARKERSRSPRKRMTTRKAGLIRKRASCSLISLSTGSNSFCAKGAVAD